MNFLSDVGAVEISHSEARHTDHVQTARVKAELGMFMAPKASSNALVLQARSMFTKLGEICRKIIPRGTQSLMLMEMNPCEECSQRQLEPRESFLLRVLWPSVKDESVPFFAVWDGKEPSHEWLASHDRHVCKGMWMSGP